MDLIYKKIVFLGDEKAGKTALVNAIQEKAFNPEYRPTIGVDFARRSYEFKGNTLQLHLWDTSGQKRFKPVTASYHRGADVFVYVVDTTSEASELLVNKIVKDLQEAYSHQGPLNVNPVPILLVGSKQDLATEQRIDAPVFLKTISAMIRSKDPTLNLIESYTLSAKMPYESNPALRLLVGDMLFQADRFNKAPPPPIPTPLDVDSGDEMRPRWWIDACETLQNDIKELPSNKKLAIDAAIVQLRPVILSNKPFDEKMAAISVFTQQCDNALGRQYLSAKKALYVFALTAICSLIALAIAALFGVSGVALLATVAVAGCAGLGTGLLTKNGLFKPVSNDETTDFSEAIGDRVKNNAPV